MTTDETMHLAEVYIYGGRPHYGWRCTCDASERGFLWSDRAEAAAHAHGQANNDEQEAGPMSYRDEATRTCHHPEHRYRVCDVCQSVIGAEPVDSVPVDWPSRFRAAADAAGTWGGETHLWDVADDLEHLPPDVVEAIGRALNGEPS